GVFSTIDCRIASDRLRVRSAFIERSKLDEMLSKRGCTSGRREFSSLILSTV
ncbi:hypothetical protein VCHENC02_5932B, partial [Vibrio harveyi]